MIITTKNKFFTKFSIKINRDPRKVSPKVSFSSHSLKIGDLIENTNKDMLKEFKNKTVEKLTEKAKTEIDLIEEIRKFQNHSYKSTILHDLNVLN